MSSFRTYVWDPALIVSQMVCMQAVFYSIECFVMTLERGFGYEPTLDHIFSATTIRAMVPTQLFAALGCAVALSLVVGRAKQCLDFAATVHFWHLVAVVVYNKTFPTQLTWWLLQVASIAIATVLGEFLCMRIESREILLSTAPSKYDL